MSSRAPARVGADVIYTSTDAVFSGDGRAVDERAQPDPIWDYGRWKVEAENIALDASIRSSVVRLPLVISLDPEDRGTERIRSGAGDGRANPMVPRRDATACDRS